MQEQTEFQLDHILKDCWQRLVDGAQSPKHPFHFPVISTINEGFPESRLVVLRDVNPKENTLFFYSDVRSPKIQQIKVNSNTSWLFYHPEFRIQLRIKGLSSIHYQDELCESYWKSLKKGNKKDYSTILAPSNPIEKEVEFIPENHDEKLFENFAVVETEVFEIDWLKIESIKHKRARFIKDKSGFMSEWLVP